MAILRRLDPAWQGLDPASWPERVVPHYLDGRVHADVFAQAGCKDKAGGGDPFAGRGAADVGEVMVYLCT